MDDIKRKLSEAISICLLEPELKNIYVEGLSDKLVIDNFLEYHEISDTAVLTIDEIDFSEVPTEELPDNNKERVIFLARTLEKEVASHISHTLCIIDIDTDFALNNIRTSKYLTYTDYNSLELYLFKERYISKLLKNTFRITKEVPIKKFTRSLQTAGRQLFYIRCVLAPHNGSCVDIRKDFDFNKTEFSCALDLNAYWNKVMQQNKLTSVSGKLKKQYEFFLQNANKEFRLEIIGHDFIHLLYESVKKYKKVNMSEDEMANTFWIYLDNTELQKEPLFQRIKRL